MYSRRINETEKLPHIAKLVNYLNKLLPTTSPFVALALHYKTTVFYTRLVPFIISFFIIFVTYFLCAFIVLE